MSTEIQISSLYKFDGTEYQVWKYQMRLALIAGGIYEVVTGEEKKPGTEKDKAEKLKKWIQKDSKAAYYLSQTNKTSFSQKCSWLPYVVK